MKALDNELAQMQFELGNNYNVGNLSNLEAISCSDVARYFYGKLIDLGKSPKILVFGERYVRPMSDSSQSGKRISFNDRGPHYWQEVFTKELIPIIFSNVEWGSHEVCICDDQLYDPSLGRRVNIDKYMKLMFGKEIEFEELIQ